MRMREEIEITPEMIEAGVSGLSTACPLDVAFPVGGEEIAVEAVLRFALAAARPQRPGMRGSG